MYPAPPVTRIFNENPPSYRLETATFDYTENAKHSDGKNPSGKFMERSDARKTKDRIESSSGPEFHSDLRRGSNRKAKAPNRSFTSCAALLPTNFALVMYSL